MGQLCVSPFADKLRLRYPRCVPKWFLAASRLNSSSTPISSRNLDGPLGNQPSQALKFSANIVVFEMNRFQNLAQARGKLIKSISSPGILLRFLKLGCLNQRPYLLESTQDGTQTHNWTSRPNSMFAFSSPKQSKQKARPPDDMHKSKFSG